MENCNPLVSLNCSEAVTSSGWVWDGCCIAACLYACKHTGTTIKPETVLIKSLLWRSQLTVNLPLMIADCDKHQPISMIITGRWVVFRVDLIATLYQWVYLHPGFISTTILEKPNTVKSITSSKDSLLSFTPPWPMKHFVSVFWAVVCSQHAVHLKQSHTSHEMLSPNGSSHVNVK